VAVALLVVHALPATARTLPKPLSVAMLDAADAAIPMADDEALNRIRDAAERRYNAKVTKVTEIMVDGRRVYELRLLSEQRIWMIRVDAESGRELPPAG
jgi:uncharacterized membrane protein YkoI